MYSEKWVKNPSEAIRKGLAHCLEELEELCWSLVNNRKVKGSPGPSRAPNENWETNGLHSPPMEDPIPSPRSKDHHEQSDRNGGASCLKLDGEVSRNLSSACVEVTGEATGSVACFPLTSAMGK